MRDLAAYLTPLRDVTEASLVAGRTEEASAVLEKLVPLAVALHETVDK